MSNVSVAIIVAGCLIALVLLLVFLPKQMGEAVARIKLLKVGRWIALEFFERAETKRGATPDKAELKASVERIESGRILWVDDAPANNLLETQALRMLGVQVDVATTNVEAEAYLKAPPDYDLVLSDIARSSGPERGNVGLLMPGVIERSGSKAQLAFYVGKKEGDETRDGVPLFDTPTKLLAHVVAVLEHSPKAAAR